MGGVDAVVVLFVECDLASAARSRVVRLSLKGGVFRPC
jgi:hypothetical protein